MHQKSGSYQQNGGLYGQTLLIVTSTFTILVLSGVKFPFLNVIFEKKPNNNEPNTTPMTFSYDPYPEQIQKAIESELSHQAFYKKNVIYTIDVDAITKDSVTFTTTLEYTVKNRTNVNQEWEMVYTFNKNDGDIIEAKFDNKLVSIYSNNTTPSGIAIPYTIEPGRETIVYFKVKERYRKSDYDLYTTYYPATDLKLILNNKFQQILFDFEGLDLYPIHPETYGNQTIVSIDNGVLPYQGVQLSWKPKKKYEKENNKRKERSN